MRQPHALRFARPTRQRRAVQTTEALVLTALGALQHRDFSDITVAELAEGAGISVGGFYARFNSKDALLPVLAAHVLDDCRLALDAALDAAGDSIESIVRAYNATMVTKFREHRHAVIQLRRHARDGDNRVGSAVREFNAQVHQRLRSMLQERRAEIGHPNPDIAIEFGLFAASASAREAVLADALQSNHANMDDQLLVDELTRSWLNYLAPQTPSTTRRQRRTRKDS